MQIAIHTGFKGEIWVAIVKSKSEYKNAKPLIGVGSPELVLVVGRTKAGQAGMDIYIRVARCF